MKSLLILILLSTFAAFAGELVLDTPQAISVEQIKSYKITYFEVDIEAQTLVIRSNALDVGGKVISSDTKVFEGMEFLQIIAAMPDANKNMYDNISGMLYNKLKDSMATPGQVIE